MKRILIITIIAISTLSIGISSHAEETTVQTTPFTDTMDVSTKTGNIWKSKGVLRYNDAVVYDSGDLEAIGEELKDLNTDLSDLKAKTELIMTGVVDKKTSIAQQLNTINTQINTKLNPSVNLDVICMGIQ